MARPVKSGKEKAVVLSVSCSPEDKEFIDRKGISPSSIFQQAINNLRTGIEQNSNVNEVEKDIEILRKYFIESAKPEGNTELYYKAINMFLEKHPNWQKAEVIQRAERPRHVILEETQTEGGTNVL